MENKISFGNVKKNKIFLWKCKEKSKNLLFTVFLAKNIKKCQIQKNRFLSLKCQFKKSYGDFKFFSLELQRKIKFPLEL